MYSLTTVFRRFPYVRLHAVLALVLLAALVAPGSTPTRAAGIETFTIGESIQGRPIEGVRIGTGPRSIVLVGAIHGSEQNSAVLTGDLLDHFSANQHLLPADVSLYFVRELNPDGVAVGSRYNANGVDLNRNWPTENWQPDTFDASGSVPGGGGPYPLSEPETAAMAGWLSYLRDSSSSVTAVFYHSAYPPSGLVLGGSVGAPLTPAYADIVGYGKPAPSRPGWSAYPVTGLAPIWCGDNGIGCFEVELPSRANLTAGQTYLHAAAVLSVLIWEQAQPGQYCFVETGWCISGRIKQFWEQHGGLTIFGLPLSPQRAEIVDGVERQVQLFERNRLELHPENPPPYDVQIGRVGVERLEQQGRNWFTFEQYSSQEGCRFLAETGQNVCGELLAAWQASGLEFDGQRGISAAESLALFGLPISPAQEETLADGQTYTVQWFERARLEIHPALPAPFRVQLGLLGSEMQQAADQAGE